jgi:hypothetical protein
MYMTSFHHYFPEVARTETRSATISGSDALPNGEYGFFESYCDDPSCDCRRVLINVYRSDDRSKIWAVINYGWENVAFYRQWVRSSEVAQEVKGPALDPLHHQSEYAPALLKLFKAIIQDDRYVQTLKQHYGLCHQVFAVGYTGGRNRDDHQEAR